MPSGGRSKVEDEPHVQRGETSFVSSRRMPGSIFQGPVVMGPGFRRGDNRGLLPRISAPASSGALPASGTPMGCVVDRYTMSNSEVGDRGLRIGTNNERVKGDGYTRLRRIADG